MAEPEVYHLVRADAELGRPLVEQVYCDTAQPSDQFVTEVEATNPAGRHFNCVHCHKALTGGQKHVTPPPDWDGGP